MCTVIRKVAKKKAVDIDTPTATAAPNAASASSATGGGYVEPVRFMQSNSAHMTPAQTFMECRGSIHTLLFVVLYSFANFAVPLCGTAQALTLWMAPPALPLLLLLLRSGMPHRGS